MTIGEFVVDHPQAVGVLESLGIDFCCGGGRDLTLALREKGLEPETFLTVVRASASAAPDGSRASAGAARLDTPALIQHIVGVHHTFLRRSLPRLCDQAAKVARAHSDRNSDLAVLETAVHQLSEELLAHLQDEEENLFPAILAGQPDTRGFVVNLTEEHEKAGGLLAHIRQASGDYRSPDWACSTYRALMAGLKALEEDLHLHIHLENNVLFRRLGGSF